MNKNNNKNNNRYRTTKKRRYYKPRVSKVQLEIEKNEKITAYLIVPFCLFALFLVTNLIILSYYKTSAIKDEKKIEENVKVLNSYLSGYEDKLEELNKLEEENKDKVEAYENWKKENERIKSLS